MTAAQLFPADPAPVALSSQTLPTAIAGSDESKLNELGEAFVSALEHALDGNGAGVGSTKPGLKSLSIPLLISTGPNLSLVLEEVSLDERGKDGTKLASHLSSTTLSATPAPGHPVLPSELSSKEAETVPSLADPSLLSQACIFTLTLMPPMLPVTEPTPDLPTGRGNAEAVQQPVGAGKSEVNMVPSTQENRAAIRPRTVEAKTQQSIVTGAKEDSRSFVPSLTPAQNYFPAASKESGEALAKAFGDPPILTLSKPVLLPSMASPVAQTEPELPLPASNRPVPAEASDDPDLYPDNVLPVASGKPEESNIESSLTAGWIPTATVKEQGNQFRPVASEQSDFAGSTGAEEKAGLDSESSSTRVPLQFAPAGVVEIRDKATVAPTAVPPQPATGGKELATPATTARPADPGEALALTQGGLELPGLRDVPEEVAANAEQPRIEEGSSKKPIRAIKAAFGAGFMTIARPAAHPSEVRGTAVANTSVGMESFSNSESQGAGPGAGRNDADELSSAAVKRSAEQGESTPSTTRSLVATEWQTGGPVANVDRSSPEVFSPGPSQAVRTIERIESLLVRESALIKQHATDSMSLLVRPDAHTELVLHLVQRDGQVEAFVRCERGDFGQLSNLWPQLQESLAVQKVRLAPLQESSLYSSNSQEPGGAIDLSQGGQPSYRQSSSGEESAPERPAAAPQGPSAELSPSWRGTSDSSTRLTSSRPGWETWA